MTASVVMYGKFRGTVEDNQDPTQRGRLKVRVPAALGEEIAWALPCVPYAGAGVGVFMVPPAGASVWVEFEEGDLARPIWTGCLWKDAELPPDEEGSPPIPEVKMVRSEKGLILRLDDRDPKIVLSDGSGENQIRVEVQRGEIRIKADTRVIVEAPQVELGGQASEPVVRGDELLQYLSQLVAVFNAHVHPGETALFLPVTPAPPAPPQSPPNPGMVSKDVKV